MVRNSALYECTIMHNRKEKSVNKFYYKYFMFYFDLDEIDTFAAKLKLFNRNKFNVFNFRDTDHLAIDKPGVKTNILKYVSEQGVAQEIGKVMLLTNVATFGYNFNPVSFYFCYDKNNNPLCAVPEVGNTYHELKPFFMDRSNFDSGEFRALMQKNFYVSPFIEHDVYFDFRLKVPGEKLNIKIDDYRGDERIFVTHLSGKREALTDRNLVKYSFKYPFVTLKVIGGIHWQALKLWIKKVRFFGKNEFLELQKGAIAKWKE